MKIIFQSTGQRIDIDFTAMSLKAREFGHEVFLWNETKDPIFHLFEKNKPDIIICQSIEFSDSIVKCLNMHPDTKLGLYIHNNIPPPNLSKLTRPIDVHFTSYPETESLVVVGKQHHNLFPCLNQEFADKPISIKFSTNLVFLGNFNSESKPDIYKYIYPLVDTGTLTVFGAGEWIIPEHLGILNYTDVHSIIQQCKGLIHLGNYIGWPTIAAAYYNKPVYMPKEYIYIHNELFLTNIVPVNTAQELLIAGQSNEVLYSSKDMVLNNYTSKHLLDQVLLSFRKGVAQ